MQYNCSNFVIRSLSTEAKAKEKTFLAWLAVEHNVFSIFLKLHSIISILQPDCSLSHSGFFHMYDLGVSYTFHFHKKNTESSVIFLRNDVLILNGKENKEASAICFEIRIPKKKNKELLRKVPSKIYEVILLWKKTKLNFGL